MSMAEFGPILGFLAESSQNRDPAASENAEIDPATPRPGHLGATAHRATAKATGLGLTYSRK